jgi:hypothetical protein
MKSCLVIGFGIIGVEVQNSTARELVGPYIILVCLLHDVSKNSSPTITSSALYTLSYNGKCPTQSFYTSSRFYHF